MGAANDRIQNGDTNAANDSDRRSVTYNGVEYAFNMQLPGGATVFGGVAHHADDAPFSWHGGRPGFVCLGAQLAW